VWTTTTVCHVPGSSAQTLATTIMLETGTIARFAQVGNCSSYFLGLSDACHKARRVRGQRCWRGDVGPT
jgi:hypothetical protein